MIQLELPILRPPVLRTKPPEGAPCNGCGQCCSEEVCVLGELELGADATHVKVRPTVLCDS